jgi:two-component system uhpT operon response regulator UhpA
MNLKRVLVVDDDFYVSQFLSTFLKRKKIDSLIAHDKAQVDAVLKKEPPCDAVILDLRLKDCEGTDLIPGIHSQWPGVPIVVLTGMGYDEAHMQEALNKGARGYVSKTLPPDELLAAIERAVGGPP